MSFHSLIVANIHLPLIYICTSMPSYSIFTNIKSMIDVDKYMISCQLTFFYIIYFSMDCLWTSLYSCFRLSKTRFIWGNIHYRLYFCWHTDMSFLDTCAQGLTLVVIWLAGTSKNLVLTRERCMLLVRWEQKLRK
jgi:hypothetical protein